jgi:DNA-binding Lrp family transcriptional regulator
MDETDLKLIQMLLRDPRKSYKELGDALGISAPAVHKRVQAARDAGILKGPYACVSPAYLGAVSVTIFGKSSASGLDEVAKAIGNDGNTRIVTELSGMHILVRGVLRNLKELDAYADSVMRKARISEPEIGVGGSDDEGLGAAEAKLTKLDFRIIKSLREDGRRPVKDVAKDVGATSKTVKSHLEKLRGNGLMLIDLHADQSASGNFVAMLHVRLAESADRRDIAKNLRQVHAREIVGMQHFSNLPRTLLAYAWLRSMSELSELSASVGASKGVESVVPHVFVRSARFDTWIDDAVDNPDDWIP